MPACRSCRNIKREAIRHFEYQYFLIVIALLVLQNWQTRFYWHTLAIDQKTHFGNAEFTMNFQILRSNGRVADWTPMILTKSLLGQTFQLIPEIWRIPLSSNNEKGFYWGRSGSQEDLPIHRGKRCIWAITRARRSKCWITIAFRPLFCFAIYRPPTSEVLWKLHSSFHCWNIICQWKVFFRVHNQ